jgi:hypothetical protein
MATNSQVAMLATEPRTYPFHCVIRRPPHPVKFRTGFIQYSARSSWRLDKKGEPPGIVEGASESNASK